MKVKKSKELKGTTVWLCTKCREYKPKEDYYKDKRSFNGITSYCKKCHTETTLKTRSKDNTNKLNKEYAKRRRKNNPEIVREYEKQASRKRDRSIKTEARTMLNNAARDGRIIKPTLCTSCNLEKKLAGHHNDYEKPLEVVWLCYECHAKEHSND